LCSAVLQSYYEHVEKYPDMMLTRFFGLHRVKPQGGRNVRFVVMGNILNTSHVLHRKYDLKGSTHGRLTLPPFDPERAILKDLDIDCTFKLDDGFPARLKAQLAADCDLLARVNVMDYSLLLGVHFRNRGKGSRPATRAPKAEGEEEDEEEEEEEEEGEEFSGVTNARLGINMTATAVPGRVLKAPRGTKQTPLPTESAPVIVNFGIIDFLQEYNLTKLSENVWKARTRGGLPPLL